MVRTGEYSVGKTAAGAEEQRTLEMLRRRSAQAAHEVFAHEWIQARLWTNIETWSPRDPKEWCEWCKTNTEHGEQICPRKGSKKPRPNLKDYNKKAAVNRIPPSMMSHWAEAALKEIGVKVSE